jgi:APA family basic amino acid/polyamine antiporter
MLVTAVPLAGLMGIFAWGLISGQSVVGWPAPGLGTSGTEVIEPTGALLALGAALVPVFFTYSGWSAAAYVAGEVRDARKALPWALLIGTSLVTVLYLAVNSVLLVTLPPAELAGSTTAVTDAATRLLGVAAARPMAVVIVLALLGSANVTLMAGARIYYAMAVNGLAPKALGRVSSTGVPAVALWASGAWTALLAASGTIELLASWVTLAMLLLSSLTVIGLFVLRSRDSVGGGPAFRCPGYPTTPVIYVAASLWVAAGSILYDPWGGLSGLGLVAAGVPVYFLAVRRNR